LAFRSGLNPVGHPDRQSLFLIVSGSHQQWDHPRNRNGAKATADRDDASSHLTRPRFRQRIEQETSVHLHHFANMKNLIRIFGLAICCALTSGIARAACQCEYISFSAGFDRAQYVFSGMVVEAAAHEWSVSVNRVWKGKLARSVMLKDAFSFTDCEFFFRRGQSYLFFAVKAKGGKAVFYHPQACNWTSPLQSSSVVTKGTGSMGPADLVVREHGPGEPPG
jgi:hypothetical protein